MTNNNLKNIKILMFAEQLDGDQRARQRAGSRRPQVLDGLHQQDARQSSGNLK